MSHAQTKDNAGYSPIEKHKQKDNCFIQENGVRQKSHMYNCITGQAASVVSLACAIEKNANPVSNMEISQKIQIISSLEITITGWR